MYAIVKTGGKQYRVEQGQSLLVERLPVEDGGKATLQPLLYVDGDNVVDGEGLAKVSILARVVGHERGPKLRVVKFKPKRGYKRRTGHRQELTRIEVTEIKLSERRPSSRRAAASDASEEKPKPARTRGAASGATEEKPKPARARTQKPAAQAEAPEAPAKPARPPRKHTTSQPAPEEGNGA
jgi:large subunit ribosomal protein L21